MQLFKGNLIFLVSNYDFPHITPFSHQMPSRVDTHHLGLTRINIKNGNHKTK